MDIPAGDMLMVIINTTTIIIIVTMVTVIGLWKEYITGKRSDMSLDHRYDAIIATIRRHVIAATTTDRLKDWSEELSVAS